MPKRKLSTLCLLGAVGASFPFAMNASAAEVTLGWDASLYDNNSNWEVNEFSAGIADGASVRWQLISPADYATSQTTNFNNIDSYFSSPSYDLRRDGGGESFRDILGNAATTADAAWEMIFRPGDFTGNKALFDTGGTGAGTGLRLVGSTLNFRFQDGSTAGNFVELNADLSAIGGASDFYHVVAVANLGAASSVSSIYINGLQVAGPGANTSGITNWDGADDAGLGKVGGTSPQGVVFDTSFAGDIAVFRHYNSQLLDGSESRNLFASTTGNRNTATMGWDAADYNGSGTWTVSESDPNVAGASDVVWHTGTGTKETGTTNFANVNDWISNPSFLQGTNPTPPGAVNFDGAIASSFTTSDATWEVILRPEDFSGKHLIFEHGGDANGVIMQIDGSTLTFIAQGGGAGIRQVFDVDLNTIDTADQFFHIIAAVETGTTGNADGLSGLYVNGALVDDVDNSGGIDLVNDWAGADGGALGSDGTGSTAFGNTGDYTDFTGDLAILRIYGDQAFDQAAVDAAYATLVPEPSSLALLGLGGLLLSRRRRRA